MSLHPIVEEDLQTIVSSKLALEKFAGQTILISGAAGMLPGYITEALLHAESQGIAAGLKVIALVRNVERAKTRFQHWLGSHALQILHQDVCDPIPDDVRADYVVHAASPAAAKKYLASPADTMRTNTLGTTNMLELARRSDSKAFLLLSSGAVYGLGVSDAPLMREDDYGIVDPLDHRSCYAEGKRAAEALCVAYFRQHGVPIRIARISHTYGPGMDLSDGRVFSDFVSDIVARRNIILKSAGTDTRPFCYVSDATVAFLALLLSGENGEPYNVGMDKETSIGDLADLLVDLFPDRGLVVERKVEASVGVARSGGVFDLSKIKSLGWQPTTPIHEGFTRTIKFFESDAS